MATPSPFIKRLSFSVLVVDDNRDAANSLNRLLVRWGYASRVAYDGPTALELARTHQPAVVLLDLGMPEMDGYQVAEQLRSHFPRTTLIAVTARAAEQDRHHSLLAGFRHHLVKPVDPDELRTMLALLKLTLPADPEDPETEEPHLQR